MPVHSFIHSRINKVPLQETYSEVPPAQPRRYKSVLSNLQNALSLLLGIGWHICIRAFIEYFSGGQIYNTLVTDEIL